MLAAAMLLFNACSNKDSVVITSDNTWKLGNTIHFVTSTTQSGGQLTFNDNTEGRKGTLTVTFKTIPTAGSYQVVANNGSEPGDKQCFVSATDNSGAAFTFATGSVNATVSFDSKNQIAIAIPELTLVGTTPGNTLTLSATVYNEDQL